MKNRILLGGLFLLCSVLLHAQELKVESFSVLERDLLPRTAERLDLNEVPCAVLRVSVADAKSFTFTGNIIGDVAYRPGEAIVYLTGYTYKGVESEVGAICRVKNIAFSLGVQNTQFGYWEGNAGIAIMF